VKIPATQEGDVVRVLEEEGISTFTASGNELFEQPVPN
jgi:hypothetical protein